MLSAFSALAPTLPRLRAAFPRATTPLYAHGVLAATPFSQSVHRTPPQSAQNRPPANPNQKPKPKRSRKQKSKLAQRQKRQRPPGSAMKVAVVGCAHGEIDALYAAVAELERAADCTVDLVICPGDFQAVRDRADLQSLACPPRYRDMRSFWKYYDGTARAPVPTVFVGGNHEASNYLQELPFGGLVAPNMYFLGQAGVVSFGGLRIAGLSGVYTEHNYAKPRRERPPYRYNEIKTVYHTRKQDVDRLLRLRRPVDVFISHDWPRGITDHGNLRDLLAAKPFLASEVYAGSFGSPASTALLDKLQPSYWFAAHMHVKFPAIVRHGDTGKRTKFLALDKIIPRRDFIQLIDIPVANTKAAPTFQSDTGGDGAASPSRVIELDPEWLAVLRTEAGTPDRETAVTDEEMAETVEHLKGKGVPLVVKPDTDFDEGKTGGGKTEGRRPKEFRLQPRSEQLFEGLGLPIPDNMRTMDVQDPVEALRQHESVGMRGVLPEVTAEELGEHGSVGLRGALPKATAEEPSEHENAGMRGALPTASAEELRQHENARMQDASAEASEERSEGSVAVVQQTSTVPAGTGEAS